MSLGQEYSPSGRPQLLHVKGPAMVPLAYRPLPTAPPYRRWNGTSTTTTPFRKSSAPLISRAVWLWSRCCHQRAGTNSGRMIGHVVLALAASAGRCSRERRHQRPVGRGQHHQRDAAAPLAPLLLELLRSAPGRSRRRPPSRRRRGSARSAGPRPPPGAGRPPGTSTVCVDRRRPARSPSSESWPRHVGVVAVDRHEQRHQQGDQQHDHPGAVAELGDRDDHEQHDGGRWRRPTPLSAALRRQPGSRAREPVHAPCSPARA